MYRGSIEDCLGFRYWREVSAEELTVICKGALEEVVGLCDALRLGGKVAPLAAPQRHLIRKRGHTPNDDGYRVLAVATRALQVAIASSLVLEGVLTFLDPPREDAATSIASLRDLGVEIKVLTGDSLRIASKVRRSLNITGGDVGGGLRAITGSELTSLSADGLYEAVRGCTVFAKLTPTQKGQIITSLKSAGRCVGMLGDGINDCVALRFADVGVSVSNAVNVSKDCADVLLTSKDLSIIASAVRIGRLTHGNTMKYIKTVASSNFGNVFSILIASVWLPFQPMTSLQILLQNLLYDISQLALPWDRMDASYIQVPQAWDTVDLLRFILILGPTSSTVDVCTFCLGWFFYDIRTADSPAIPLFHTHWFLEGLMAQTLIVHRENPPASEPRVACTDLQHSASDDCGVCPSTHQAVS